MSERSASVDRLTRSVQQLAAGDPGATRIVYAIVIALIIVGVVLVGLAIWMIRRTRPDLELLGPLERMSESKWRKSGPDARQALLDEVRPAGAAVAIVQPHDTALGSELPPPLVEPVAEEMPEVEMPEVEMPEVETPEVEMPEVPEVEVPEVPEVEGPEVAVPEVSEVEAPDVSEVEVPDVPEVSVAEVAEVSIAEAPIEAPTVAPEADIGTPVAASEGSATEQ